jgi:pSer/pThr/pTyr-binding forkhead associated (FHA) protein
MANLCLLDDVGAIAQRWELADQPVAVGRDASADVTINDDSLSHRHFAILREGETYMLKDLDSQKGTWVGGQRARAAAKLRHNECIAAGRSLFLFRERPFPATD